MALNTMHPILKFNTDDKQVNKLILTFLFNQGYELLDATQTYHLDATYIYIYSNDRISFSKKGDYYPSIELSSVHELIERAMTYTYYKAS